MPSRLLPPATSLASLASSYGVWWLSLRCKSQAVCWGIKKGRECGLFYLFSIDTAKFDLTLALTIIPIMKSVLILYATREGQTEKVASQIASHLQASGASVQLVNAADSAATETLALSSFDQLVFGASMHAGGLENELVEYINRHARQIELSARSFFLVLLSAATKDPLLRAEWLEDAHQKMDEQLLVEFEDTEMIAGALKYSKYPLPLKWVMKRIAKKAGEGTDMSKDYEYTDWKQVERYAKRLSTL